MKNRVKALLLASVLCASSLSLGGAALAENSTEGVVEQITGAAADTADAAADTAGTAADTDTASQFAPYYDEIKASVPAMLEQLSAMTEEQLLEMQESEDASTASIAATWMGVREELGVPTGTEEQEIIEEGKTITVRSLVKYDGVSDDTKVYVTYVWDTKKNTSSLDWDIKYPMKKLVAEAGLNTLLGMGTVFVVLVFLSFVIGNIHWIPDLVEKTKKKKEPAPAPVAAAPAAAAVPEAAAEAEEELAGDEELVAVIAAAIAASEDVPADGFVVRSIRKARRRSW